MNEKKIIRFYLIRIYFHAKSPVPSSNNTMLSWQSNRHCLNDQAILLQYSTLKGVPPFQDLCLSVFILSLKWP